MALRKAREDFIAMLDESRDVRPGLRFSKAAALFDHDPRWSVSHLPLFAGLVHLMLLLASTSRSGSRVDSSIAELHW